MAAAMRTAAGTPALSLCACSCIWLPGGMPNQAKRRGYMRREGGKGQRSSPLWLGVLPCIALLHFRCASQEAASPP